MEAETRKTRVRMRTMMRMLGLSEWLFWCCCGGDCGRKAGIVGGGGGVGTSGRDREECGRGISLHLIRKRERRFKERQLLERKKIELLEREKREV